MRAGGASEDLHPRDCVTGRGLCILNFAQEPLSPGKHHAGREHKPGMVDTAKKNFGGGNTAWEEKTLSKYEFSEVRLLEIVEGLCEASDFECNQLLEEQEELLEAWWLRLKKKHPDLFEWFCVQTLKACCSPGTYGPDCRGMSFRGDPPVSAWFLSWLPGRRLPQAWVLPPPGCRDLLPWSGPSVPGRVPAALQRERPLQRRRHPRGRRVVPACKTCVGPTNRDCNQCEVGWVRQDDACVDVDECAAEPPPCEDTQYCENINGSFVCEECDPTCVGCTGKGPAQCRECVAGYSKDSGQCEDIDECSLAEKPCLRDNENCYNTPGSFVCVCPDGFEEAEDACVQSGPAGTEATEASPTQPPSREDL
ncbi:CRELD2 [Cervus elaphus hippelaphus]|uniref:protein disulfide-isomerase n=1 Tax=Cervus elaphus hippelaphus TaxID=46360 RepID=A0A212CC63_CEREH|nr:CRELD2 [Cervus elaphus hippelaphus]